MIYCIPIFLTIVGIVKFDFSSRATKDSVSKNFLWYTILLSLILIIGLRYGVGGDTWNYMGDYQWRVPLQEWEYKPLDPYQPGYTLLCALGKTISPEFYVFQLIHAFIINCLLFYFIVNNTKYWFSVLLAIFFTCYFYFTMEILRESLAVMVFVLNYDSYKDRKWIRYYLGVILSCTFHLSACFLIFLPFLSWLKINKTYAIICVVFFIGMFFLKNILESLTSIALVGEKISNYVDEDTHGLLADILTLIRKAIFPLVFCVVAKKIYKRDVEFENMIAIMCLFGIASFFNAIIFYRATNYFILFFSLSIVDCSLKILKSQRKVLKQYALLLTILFFITYGSEFYMYGKYKRWIPYYSIFNPVNVNRDSYKN